MTSYSKSRSYSRRSAGVLLLVGVLSGITVGGGVGAFAASSTKTVTVCADKKTNVLRYAKNSKCTKTETMVVLNQAGNDGTNGLNGSVGAKGDTGAKGDAGAAGAKGDAGDAGANATLAITQQSVCDGSDADTVANELCKIGMTGPGSGFIFFVDYNDQYAGFNYLEATPVACEPSPKSWSSTNDAVTAARGWAARAVGSGQANTTAILAVHTSDTDENNAAKYADSSNCGSKDDWFLGSLGEMELMYDNLQGVGSFSYDNYWSSSEYNDTTAWSQNFRYGDQTNTTKPGASVRPVRAF